MSSTIIQQIVALGLAVVGLASPTPLEFGPAPVGMSAFEALPEPGIDRAPQREPLPVPAPAFVDPRPTMARPAPSTEASPASQIDPALLNNPTLRRAIATVGPDLVRDPEVRHAIRTRRFDRVLLNNPTVSQAMLQVGPSLMADPELSAAARSGELSLELLSDPAVIAILRDLDPTLFEEAPPREVTVTRGESAPATEPPPAVTPTRRAPRADREWIVETLRTPEVRATECRGRHDAGRTDADARAPRSLELRVPVGELAHIALSLFGDAIQPMPGDARPAR